VEPSGWEETTGNSWKIRTVRVREFPGGFPPERDDLEAGSINGEGIMTDLGACRKFAEEKRWRLENSQSVSSPKPGTVAASLITPEGPVPLIFLNGREVLGHWNEVVRKYAA
jgi:hypothetical protein